MYNVCHIIFLLLWDMYATVVTTMDNILNFNFIQYFLQYWPQPDVDNNEHDDSGASNENL